MTELIPDDPDERCLVLINEILFWGMKNAAGYHSGPVTPSSTDAAPLAYSPLPANPGDIKWMPPLIIDVKQNWVPEILGCEDDTEQNVQLAWVRISEFPNGQDTVDLVPSF